MPRNDNQHWARAYAIYGAAGMQFVVAVGGLAVLGWWLDGKWGTDPWLAVTGVIVGSVVGFWNLYRLIKIK